MPKLSPKEAEKRINRICNLKRQSYTNPQTARKLGISLKTVERYLYEYPKGKNQAKKPIERSAEPQLMRTEQKPLSPLPPLSFSTHSAPKKEEEEKPVRMEQIEPFLSFPWPKEEKEKERIRRALDSLLE